MLNFFTLKPKFDTFWARNWTILILINLILTNFDLEILKFWIFFTSKPKFLYILTSKLNNFTILINQILTLGFQNVDFGLKTKFLTKNWLIDQLYSGGKVSVRLLNLLLRVLHELDQVVEENVTIAVAEAVRLVADFARIVMYRETALPDLEMLMAANRRTEFL